MSGKVTLCYKAYTSYLMNQFTPIHYCGYTSLLNKAKYPVSLLMPTLSDGSFHMLQPIASLNATKKSLYPLLLLHSLLP